MNWNPCGFATLVGSMPHRDRDYVISFILENLPDVPLWPQLPAYCHEQMINQYLEGLPGYVSESTAKNVIITDSASFDDELYGFYLDYFDVLEGRSDIRGSRFQFGEETGKTFKAFIEKLSLLARKPYKAIKGQVVGPFTLLSSLKDQHGRLLLYDERMADVVPKHLVMKALWQAVLLRPFAERVVIFFDEPALSGFGSSAFIGVSKEYIVGLFNEISELLAPREILTGVHVCANTDWTLLLESKIDIINCDAYNYGNKFCMYSDYIRSFVKRGGIIAWGIVPTDDPQKIEKEDGDTLSRKLLNLLGEYFYGDEIRDLIARSMITPSCGCGTLSEDLSERVVKMTVDCSNRLKGLYC